MFEPICKTFPEEAIEYIKSNSRLQPEKRVKWGRDRMSKDISKRLFEWSTQKIGYWNYLVFIGFVRERDERGLQLRLNFSYIHTLEDQRTNVVDYSADDAFYVKHIYHNSPDGHYYTDGHGRDMYQVDLTDFIQYYRGRIEEPSKEWAKQYMQALGFAEWDLF